MRTKGSFNSSTGKTTPRLKAKTHWHKGSSKRSAVAGKPAKPAAAAPAKAKPVAR